MNNDVINEIRSKTDIVDIIGERIPLVKQGKNFFGVCPFHDDKSPSLCVSREKQIFTCFSCHATGNVFKFLMDYDKMSFPSAVKYLGDRCGVAVKSFSTPKLEKYNKYYDIYNLASRYYENNLMTDFGSEARKYLDGRSLSEDTIKEFGIGLSLEKRDDLTSLLTKKGYTLVDLNKIGLSNDSHDIYNNRIMFPLYDLDGRVVGFSGRIYSSSSDNKYVNTKETPIFKKGENLYHYHIARTEARNKKFVIVMEGFMDVIRASTIGIRNTVALMGTALTDSQIKLIKRLSNNIVLCLDGDDPGRAAALKDGELFLKAGVDVKVITLPNPDDPDTFILREGKDSFNSYIEKAIPYTEYKINSLKKNVNMSSTEEVADYINSALKELSLIDDPIRIEISLKKLAKDFNIGYNTLAKRFSELKSNSSKEVVHEDNTKSAKKVKDKYTKAYEQIIYYMLTNPDIIPIVKKENLLLTKSVDRNLLQEIIYYYEKYGSINIADFMTHLSDKDELLNRLNEVVSDTYTDKIEDGTLNLYFKVIKESAIRKRIKYLEGKLAEEVDPVKQAEIGNEIAHLRIGDNFNG